MTSYYALLGLERTATEREVKAAFRRLAMNVHPDVSSLPRSEAEQRIKALLEAYEAIKAQHGWV
jgi:curved DNA-binding protein CbpA